MMMPGMPGIVPGMPGMPSLSEETLKVHIEWQIESLQSLVRQIESRQANKKKAAEDDAEATDTRDTGDMSRDTSPQ